MKSSIVNVLQKVWFLDQIKKAGDFKTAASLLGVTPSAITQSIKSLEKHFEQTLVIRSKGEILLTSEGANLLEKMSPLLAQLTELDKGLSNQEGPEKVRIGAYDSLAISYLPKLYKKIIEIKPSVKIDLQMGRSFELCSLVNQGYLDMALVVHPEESKSFHITEIAQSSLSMYIHKDNLVNGKACSKIRKGCLRPEIDGRQSFLSKALKAIDLNSRDFYVQADSLEVLLALCLEGQVCALLPVDLAERHKDKLIDVCDHYKVPNLKEITEHSLALITRETFPTAWREKIEKSLKEKY